MQLRRRKTVKADAEAAAAAASDELVRSLQSQLQSTAEQLVALGRTDIVLAVVEQVVGASGSQAVEPGQPGQPAATAQPGLPRYVVPPATGDLAYGSSHWDGKPAEIHAMILKHAGPLTRFLCGMLGDTATLDEATKRAVWTEAFKMDWPGDLALLPDVELTADNGLLLAHSRSMYDRLCKRFPDYTDANYARSDARYNDYGSFHVAHYNSSRLILIPMRHGWFDLVDFTYPITLAQLAICFGCLDLLKHLDDEYNILQDGMAEQDPTSKYWHRAVEEAASNGHLDVVQYLFSLGVSCTTDAMDRAAIDGHLHVVVWLHENRTEGCTVWAIDSAAENGHLHVVKWLHENRAEGCSDWAMFLAAEQGHLHVVKWLHETRGEECTTRALNAAICLGHIDVVKYMHSKGGRASNYVVGSAANAGDIELLRYLLDCGYPVELGSLNRAKTDIAANILLRSLTLDRAQTLLAQASQGLYRKATVRRLKSTIKHLQKPRKQ